MKAVFFRFRRSKHWPCFATQQQAPGLEGCNVIRQGSKVLQGSKIPQLQVSRIARLQISRVPRFQSSRLPGFWGFKVPSIKVPDLQGSWFDSTTEWPEQCKANPNTIGLLKFILKNTLWAVWFAQERRLYSFARCKVQSYSQGSRFPGRVAKL